MKSTTANPLPPADRMVLFLATGLGIGRVPWAPGTFGSLLGLPVAWGVGQLALGWQCVTVVGLFAIGLPICQRAAGLLHSKDPGAVVFDEIAAIPVVFLFARFGIGTAAAGFLLFRLFDIVKPWPVGWFERLPGGLGIMADDFVAALYSGGFFWCALRLLEHARVVNF